MKCWHWQKREEGRWIPAILFTITPCVYFAYNGYEALVILLIQFWGFVVTLFTKKFMDYRLEDKHMNVEIGEIKRKIIHQIHTD